MFQKHLTTYIFKYISNAILYLNHIVHLLVFLIQVILNTDVTTSKKPSLESYAFAPEPQSTPYRSQYYQWAQ